ncbi:MAG TPA: XRE family transcriptional regulator [Terriglobales bacterium]|nr:XRE family transcriptional regulator [Terriglobales bacterium]
MAKSRKRNSVPEWASRITTLRRQFKMSQGELAKRMECSAMTISRWERGLQAPTADFYIQLGKMAGKDNCWFFWERAGLQMADVARALPGTRASGPLTAVPPMENARAGSGAKAAAVPRQRIIALPVLKAMAGTHGNHGDKRLSLDRIPATRLMGAPSEWCPNPRYTSLLRVRGHSMEPLIRDGAILAVDSFQTDKDELDGKVVVVTHEENGLSVSRLRRYDDVEVLESENHEYDGVVLGKNSGWHVVGKVLWWISAAP